MVEIAYADTQAGLCYRRLVSRAAPQARQEPSDDRDLIERFLGGDGGAFTLLYRRYARYVATIAFRIIGDDFELDDLVQETFVEAAKKLSTLRDRDRLKSWLGTIVVRRTMKRIETRRRRRSIRRRLPTAPGATDPRKHDQVDALYEELSRIPPKLRAPWVLRHVHGEGLAEVAKLCGVSLATAKRRIAAAERALGKERARG